MNLDNKEKMFEDYIDDLRYLGASIPYLHWDMSENGNIYLLWDKMNSECEKHNDPHLHYSTTFRAKLDNFVNYFNLTHQTSDEDL